MCNWSHGIKLYFYRYNIYDLWSSGEYMVSMTIASCWEMYGDCAWTQTVLDYAKFPKQTCASQMAYQDPSRCIQLKLKYIVCV